MRGEFQNLYMKQLIAYLLQTVMTTQDKYICSLEILKQTFKDHVTGKTIK